MSTPAVKATGLVLSYDGRVGLESSSFVIPRGVITAMIGPNGSGKSTVLSGIAGLLRPRAGRLELAGTASRVAYVLQTTTVNEALPVTVGEVVRMSRYSTRGPYGRLGGVDQRAVAEAMDRMGLVDLAHLHLNELSEGQRRRVFVAQGLAQEHDMLLLDEPLTGLDLASAAAIDRVIHDEQERGCTVVIATHDLAEAQAADHVILLGGGVVDAGQPGDVLTIANLTAAYGPSLHVEGDRVFFDDPAHAPASGRHVHRERIIHVEAPPADLHGGEPSGG